MHKARSQPKKEAVQIVDARNAEQQPFYCRYLAQHPILQHGGPLAAIGACRQGPQALLDLLCFRALVRIPHHVQALDQKHHGDEGHDGKYGKETACQYILHSRVAFIRSVC